MRISDWSSDVCSSDLLYLFGGSRSLQPERATTWNVALSIAPEAPKGFSANLTYFRINYRNRVARSEEHTSELKSLMRSSYAVFCLKKTTDQHLLMRIYNADIYHHNNKSIHPLT